MTVCGNSVTRLFTVRVRSFTKRKILRFWQWAAWKTAEVVRHRLKEIGYSCTLVNARFVKPIDTDVVKELAKDHRLIVTMEENVRSGGYGEKVRDYVQEQEIPVHVLTIALPDEYVEHGNVALLYEEVGIDAESVTKRIIEKYVTCPKEDGRR